MAEAKRALGESDAESKAGEQERWLQPEIAPVDVASEGPLRPQNLDAWVGQAELIANLKVFIKAARARNEALDHILFAGPPGLGKTTLAHILADAMGVDLHVTAGPSLERKDLAGIVSHLQPKDILFVDEIHRLSAAVEENLYPAMEDFKFDLVIGAGPHARSIEMPLPRFTLVGATTRAGMLTGPMLDRFGFVGRVRLYRSEELALLVKRSAGLLGVPIDKAGIMEIARRSRGTPRIANRLLRRVRDFAQVEGDGIISQALADHALGRLEVDAWGLDALDRRFLQALVCKFGSGPVGLDTLCAALGEDSETLEHAVEPYLLQEGLIQRTPRGRMATLQAQERFGKKGE